MKRIVAGAFVLSLLIACQAREEPRVPDEGQSPEGASADAIGESQAQDERQDEKEGPKYEDVPVVEPGPEEARLRPANCRDLKVTNPSLPSGIYEIHPYQDGAQDLPIQASCDMETDGGGWTLILNYNHVGATNPALNIRTDSLPLAGSELLGMDESAMPEHWGHASNEMLRTLTGFRELRFYCRSSENTRVLHFKTSDASCVSAAQLGRGSCANLGKNFVPLGDHTAILPNAMDRAESDRMDEILTYNTFGRSEPETPARMWSIRAEPSQQAWECDFGTNSAMFHTLHRVWIR